MSLQGLKGTEERKEGKKEEIENKSCILVLVVQNVERRDDRGEEHKTIVCTISRNPILFYSILSNTILSNPILSSITGVANPGP